MEVQTEFVGIAADECENNGDLNGDGGYNVLDIVTLANCVLDGTCGGRVDDASNASLIQDENNLFIKGNGFIGGVQMTLTHGPDFSIETTDRALFADYLTINGWLYQYWRGSIDSKYRC